MHDLMDARRRLEKEDATFRRLSRKHREFESRLDELNSYRYLSRDEQYEAMKLKKQSPITPVQCLSYTLSQVGVSAALPGCADKEQLVAALAYLDAPEEARDFSVLLVEFEQYVEGECVYCNHCLPCPSTIDIGQVNRLLDLAQQELTTELQAAYDALASKPSDCTLCGACVERCPFGVSVIARMEQAVTLFYFHHDDLHASLFSQRVFSDNNAGSYERTAIKGTVNGYRYES